MMNLKSIPVKQILTMKKDLLTRIVKLVGNASSSNQSLKFMWWVTLVKNHFSAMHAKKGLFNQAIWKSIWEFTQVKNLSNANLAQNTLLIQYNWKLFICRLKSGKTEKKESFIRPILQLFSNFQEIPYETFSNVSLNDFWLRMIYCKGHIGIFFWFHELLKHGFSYYFSHKKLCCNIHNKFWFFLWIIEMCWVKSCCCVKSILHKSHLKSLLPSWTHISSDLPLDMKIFSHVTHSNSLLLPCTTEKWFCR